MNSALDSLRPAKTIVLTTYRRDGTPVPTPVSIAFDGDRAVFRSYDKAGKTRRLRRDPRVVVAPATFRGRPTGVGTPARVALLDGADADAAAAALARRHPVLQGVLVPVLHRIRHYRTMHYELAGAG